MSKVVEEFVQFQEKISTVTICEIDYRVTWVRLDPNSLAGLNLPHWPADNRPW